MGGVLVETPRGQTIQSSARDGIRVVQIAWKSVLFLGRKLLMASMVTWSACPLEEEHFLPIEPNALLLQWLEELGKLVRHMLGEHRVLP